MNFNEQAKNKNDMRSPDVFNSMSVVCMCRTGKLIQPHHKFTHRNKLVQSTLPTGGLQSLSAYSTTVSV